MSLTASAPASTSWAARAAISQPAVGGTSPAVNPLFRVTTELGFTGNVIPSFIKRNGPIREARFQFNTDGSRDGGVHALFVITGHPEAQGCNIQQEDFERQVRNNNIIFRIPTPVFGAGLIEQIPDSAILANLSAHSVQQERPRHQRARQPQRQRRDDLPVRLEGAEPVAAALLRRGVQRRDGDHQRAVPDRAGRDRELPVRDGTQRCDPERSPDRRHRELRQLPALPGSADAVPPTLRAVRPRSAAAASNSPSRLRPLPHADAEDRQYHRRRPGQPDRNLFSDLAASRHGARTRRRHPPGRGPR